MVSVGHYLAAYTGNRILMEGGNAMDSGLAMQLNQSVLEWTHMGFGGEFPLLYYSADDDQVYYIDGNTASPKSVDVEWFQEQGLEAIPGDGNLAAGVPAVPAAVIAALDRFGTMSFAEIAEDAIKLAVDGFPLDPTAAGPGWGSIEANAERFELEWPSSYELYLGQYDGRIPEVNELFVNPDLGGVLQMMADAEQEALASGATRSEALRAAHDVFYKGEIAEIIIDFARNTPLRDASGEEWTSNLTLEDFATYEAIIREPWSVTYTAGDGSEYVVYKSDTSGQGPVFLQQLLMLQEFDLQEFGYGTADYWHTVIEVSKLAFADRGEWYGDPMFVDVPKEGLLSPEYARARLEEHFSMDRALNENIPGDPWAFEGREAPRDPRLGAPNVSPDALQIADLQAYADAYGGSTSSTRAMDKAGNLYSATPSGGWYHANPVIPGLGFVLNSRIQMFRVDRADHAKTYIPGARPSTSLTPTLIMKDGEAFMGLGTAGGDAQDQYTLQTFLNVVEFGFELQEAIDEPKARHYNAPGLFYPFAKSPGRVRVNSFPFGLDEEVYDELFERGHMIEWFGPGFTTASAIILYDKDTGLMRGAASPARNKHWTIGW